MNEIEVPLKVTGISAIKKELRDLKGQLADATDPEQIQKLSERAGELSDKLKDANDQVKVFASGSKFEQVSNGIGGIKDSLMSLDFAEAGQKAKAFTQNLKSLNPADFAAQFKGFGTVIMSVASTVGILTKQFIAMGISLLTNPIFLLVAVIVAIVAAVLLLLHKLGILEKIFDAIMVPIKAVIQAFKDLTDWLGLTSYAAEENAEKMIAANEKVVESSKRRSDSLTASYDFEIKMAKLRGQETLDLEIKKSKGVEKESLRRVASGTKALFAELKLGEDADKKKIAELGKQIEEEKKLIEAGQRDRKYLVAEDYYKKREEAKKEADASAKEAEEAAKKQADANKKAAEAAKKYALDRLAAQRTIKDIELGLIKDDSDREEAITKEKYARLIEDVQKSETYTKDEKIKLKALYTKQLKVELDKQAQVEIDAEKEKQKKLLDEYNAGLIKQYELADKQYLRLQELTTSQTEFEKLQLSQKFDAETAAAGENQELIKALTIKYQADLNAIDKKASEEKIKIQEDEAKKIRDTKIKAAQDDLQIAESSVKSIQAIGDIAFAAKMSKVKKGSKEEEELAKKQFKFNKSLQLAGAIVDAGKAITASLASSPLAIGVVPNPIGIANLVATAAVSAANIAKIASTQFTSTAGGGGTNQPSLPGASSTSTTGATPSFNLFGQGNNMNNVGANGQTQATEITVKAVVSETELTNTQNKIAKINKNATL
jgi:hypothetical protein